MVRSPWSERNYVSSDVKLIPARHESSSGTRSGRRDSSPFTPIENSEGGNKDSNSNSNKETVTSRNPSPSLRSGAETNWARSIPPPPESPRHSTSRPPVTPRGRSPSPGPPPPSRSFFNGSGGIASNTSASRRSPSPSSKRSKDPPPSPRLSSTGGSSRGQQLDSSGARLPPPPPSLLPKSPGSPPPKQQQKKGREPPPSSPRAAPDGIRHLWAQLDRDATGAGVKASQRPVHTRQQQQAQQQQQLQQARTPPPPQRKGFLGIATRSSSDSNLPRGSAANSSGNSIISTGSNGSGGTASAGNGGAQNNARIATLSQTLNLQAEQLATMERDYLNLITNLETEKRRVTDMLDYRTKERDMVNSDVERLKRQLASKSNMTIKSEEEAQASSERITSLEMDLERCKDALSQRDELIASRNTELESMRQAVCAAAEEKLSLQEQAREEGERRDKIQSNKLDRAMSMVAEKDELIKEKEMEIDELRESILKRKKEREALKLDVDALQEELEGEQANIAECKSTMAGYRLEIRRLEALDREREENAATRSLEEEKRVESHATAAREAKAKVDELNATLATREKENSALSKQVEELKAQLQTESDKMADLFDQISTLKADLETARTSTPETVQRELEEQADKISTLELELSKKDDDIETKSGELQRLQTELTQVAESNTSICQELERTKDRLEEEIAQADESKKSFEEMHGLAMKTLSEELDETKSQLEIQKDLTEDLQQQVNFMEDAAGKSREKSKEEIEVVLTELEASKTEAKDLQNKCEALQKQLDSLASENNAMESKHNEDMDALKAELHQTKAKLDEEMEQGKGWKDYIDRLEKEVQQQKDAVDAARELSATNYMNARAAERDANEELNKQYLDAKTRLEQAEEDNNHLKSELADREDLIAAKEDEMKGVKAMIRAFEQEKDALDAELKSTKDKLEVSRAEAAAATTAADSTSRPGGGWLRRGGPSKNIEDIEATISEKDRTIEAKSHEVQALMADLQQSMQEREDMRSALELLKMDMERRIDALIQEKQQISDEKTTMREELDQSFADNANLKQEIGELKEQLVYESTRAYRMKKEIASLSAAASGKEVSTPEMHSRAVGSDDAILSSSESSDGVSRSLHSKLDEVMKETERKRQRMNRIRERLESANSSPSKDAAVTDNSATCQHLQATLEEKEAQLKSKAEQVEELERLMQDMTASHTTEAAITKEFDAVEKTVSDYESRIDDLQKDLADRDSVVSVKNDEIENLQSTLEECKTEKQALIDGISELKAQLQAEAKRAAELLAAEKEARAEITRLEATIEAREEEIANLAMSSGSSSEDSEAKANEIRELREQLIEESRCAFQLSKEVDALKSVNERANEEIEYLKDEVAKSPERGENEDTGIVTPAQVWHENEALKHEFESVAHQLQEISRQNAELKSELDVLRRRDVDDGRRSAVFRARSQPWSQDKKPWSLPPKNNVKLAPPKSDTPKIDFGDCRDDRDDASPVRSQSGGDQRYESSSRNNPASEWHDDNMGAEAAAAEIESLKRALEEAEQEKAGLDEAVRNREKYVAELEFKCSEYSKKISELKRYVTAQNPSANAQQALALKEKEVERLHKDMVSLKMLASAKFRELESRAARAIDHEEQAQALRVALENTKAEHAKEIAQLKAEQSGPSTSMRKVEVIKEAKGFREGKLQHKYEVMLQKAGNEKDILRKEVVALTSERNVFLEKIRELEQKESSSLDVSTKMIMSENNALKIEVEKLSKEKKRLRGKLEYYELI